MSTTARRYWLKALRAAGVRNFRAKSGLGLPFICHLGDRAGELPFYDRGHSVAELAVMASWCSTLERPAIFDVGANNGFIATQLAQLLGEHHPIIYAFEPVPSTFAQLAFAVTEMGLEKSIVPVCCAISDSAGVTTLSYNPRESLFAQVRDDNLNTRVGKSKVWAATISLDAVVAATGIRPALLKIDVEGFEARVLAGAENLLNGEDRPAICFEWNPLTLEEVGVESKTMLTGLTNYEFYYVDDFAGQKLPLGEPIGSLIGLQHACNVFAVPKGEAGERNWKKTLLALRKAE